MLEALVDSAGGVVGERGYEGQRPTSAQSRQGLVLVELGLEGDAPKRVSGRVREQRFHALGLPVLRRPADELELETFEQLGLERIEAGDELPHSLALLQAAEEGKPLHAAVAVHRRRCPRRLTRCA